MDINEIEPTTQNTHKHIFEEGLNIVVDELVHLYFGKVNEGKSRKIRRFS